MKVIGMSLIVVSLGACPHPAKEVVTLTFLDPEWSHDLTERNVLPDERLQEFTRQTGIRVKHLPAPETALDQLGMARELFRKGSSGPDVSGVDVMQTIDNPSAYIRLYKKGTDESIGTYLVSLLYSLQKLPDEFEVDGKKYQLSLRLKRYYKPFSIHLSTAE